MTNEKEIYVHVGMPKTASSYLRDQFFPNVEDATVFFDLHQPDPIAQFMLRIANLQQEFGRDIEKAKFDDIDLHRQRIGEFVKALPGKRIIISWSSFVCSFGGARDDFKSVEPAARWLKEVFPNAKIIMVIRRQDTYIESNFSQAQKKIGYAGDLNSFISEGQENQGAFRIDPELCNYQRFYRVYESHFGPESVLVMPFERIRSERTRFLEAIASFMKVAPPEIEQAKREVNLGYSGVSTSIARAYNMGTRSLGRVLRKITGQPLSTYIRNPSRNIVERMFKYSLSRAMSFNVRVALEPMDKLLKQIGLYKKPSGLDKELKAKTLNRCRQSNRELSETLGLNLDSFGYF